MRINTINSEDYDSASGVGGRTEERTVWCGVNQGAVHREGRGYECGEVKERSVLRSCVAFRAGKTRKGHLIILVQFFHFIFEELEKYDGLSKVTKLNKEQSWN